LTRSFGITILLAVLISGVGHIYLGIIKRGIIILIVGIALWIFAPLFVPFPLSWVINGAYWLWQLVDVIRLYRKMKSEFRANNPSS
jgi:TM2 domain-containing membrane protein YozV